MSAQGGNSDDNITPVTTPIKNPDNRALAAVVADLVLEARQHMVGLRALYVSICLAENIVPRSWGMQLAEEKERHIAREAQQLASLRTVIA
ncbi:MAG TPA: hypothetical protein VGY48_15735 [Vicinamibacterales bacterium]|nr:hypothetical protein [Vicinamibacterales bacterium]